MSLAPAEPLRYQELLTAKQQRVQALFESISLPEPTVFESPAEYFRMRAEFRLWHEGDDCFYAMFAPEDRKKAIRIDELPIASEAINAFMPKVLAELLASDLLRVRCFQVEFLSTLSGEMLVTLIYHKRLEDDWLAAATELANQLGCQLIGRSRKQKLIIGSDYVTEQLHADGRDFKYLQHEGSFTQPNAMVNQKMISWACQHAAQLNGGDLLELYCGNGNFTLPLAKYFNKVLATEISKVSIRALEENCELNEVRNIEVARMSAEEVSQAIRGVREFRRLRDIDLASYNLSTVFVDPPRAGLDDFTREMVADYDNILYISCNPETMARDLKQLAKTHEIKKFAFFDQFPYTHHMECGAVLQAKHQTEESI